MKSSGKRYWLVPLIALLALLIRYPSQLRGEELPRLAWDNLRPEEQLVLKPYAGYWRDISPERRARMLKGARQWRKLTDLERRKARQRLKEWQQLTPEARQQTREGYKKFKQLPPAARHRLLLARNWYQSQSEELRRQLREDWERLGPGRPDRHNRQAGRTGRGG